MGRLAPLLKIRVEILVISPFISPVSCLPETRWEITIDYHKLSQAVALIRAAVLDMISLWEQINITSNTWACH